MPKKKIAQGKVGDNTEGVVSSEAADGKRGGRKHGTPLPLSNKTKNFSDGARSTLTAISRHWERSGKKESSTFTMHLNKQSRDDFVRYFDPFFQGMVQHYKGIKKPVKVAKKAVENVNHGESDLPFYFLRAYAAYLGIPTGLLMLFTNVMSDATQNHTKKSVLNLLTSSQAALGTLIDYLNGDTRHISDYNPKRLKKGVAFEDLLFTVHPDSELYDAHIEGLALLARTFHSLRSEEKKVIPQTIG